MASRLPPSRPVQQNEAPDFILPVVGGVKELVFGSPGLFIDRPGFIAGAAPQTAIGKAVQDLTRLNCRLWASSDKSNYSQNVNQGNADLCGPYLETLGEKPDPGKVELPFEGGQCEGVNYTINWTEEQFQNDCSTLVGNPSVGGFPGPLGQVFYTGASSCPEGRGELAFIQTGNGPALLGGAGSGVRVTINSVTRDDGQPDCEGNPDPSYTPPQTVTPGTPIVPTINIELPGLGPIEVNVNLDPRGNPIICVPDLEVCVTVDIEAGDDGGGGDGGGGDDGGGGPAPGDDGEPGGGVTAGPGGDAEGEAPEGSVIVGLQMNMTFIPPSANEYFPGVYRGAAYIYMGNANGLDQDFAGSMLEDGQFVYAEKDNLTRWRVRANNEFVFNVVPYYREVE